MAGSAACHWANASQKRGSPTDVVMLKLYTTTGTSSNVRRVTLVTTPKVPPPPPLRAQKRSMFWYEFAVTSLPYIDAFVRTTFKREFGNGRVPGCLRRPSPLRIPMHCRIPDPPSDQMASDRRP